MEMVIGKMDALRGLGKAMAERGDDYVYQPPDLNWPRCLNWHKEEDAPGCIVGLALFKLGVPAEVLRENPAGGIHGLAYDLRADGIDITPNAVKVFRLAQVVQDQKGNWGAAYAAAAEVAKFGGNDE